MRSRHLAPVRLRFLAHIKLLCDRWEGYYWPSDISRRRHRCGRRRRRSSSRCPAPGPSIAPSLLLQVPSMRPSLHSHFITGSERNSRPKYDTGRLTNNSDCRRIYGRTLPGRTMETIPSRAGPGSTKVAVFH